MGLKIKWTEEAEITFDNIIKYLRNNWTDKEVEQFIEQANKAFYHISIFPNSFKSSKSKKIRKALITKQNSVIYRINKKQIELLTFWDNRFNPKKMKY